MGLQNIVQFGGQLIGRFQKIKMRKSSQFDAQLVLNRPIWPIWSRCYELVAMKHNIIEWSRSYKTFVLVREVVNAYLSVSYQVS